MLAVPLLVYVVGVPNAHVAIGTSALAVAVSAAFGLATHLRSGNVKVACAIAFAVFGMLGAALGSTVGKAIDGDKLLALFGVVMIVVGLSIAPQAGRGRRPRREVSTARRRACSFRASRRSPLGVGFLAGFFGIGGGFLIVPGLVFSTGMPLLNAVGSSLLSVTAFGLTTAGNYALSGLVDWWIAALLIGGGFVGGVGGVAASRKLATRRPASSYAFAAIVVVVGVYVVWRGIGAFV